MSNPAFAHLTDDDPIGVNGLGSLLDDLLGVEAAIEHQVDEAEAIAATVEVARTLTDNPDWTRDLTDEEAALLDWSVDSSRTLELAA